MVIESNMRLIDLQRKIAVHFVPRPFLGFSTLPVEVKELIYEHAFHIQEVFKNRIYVDKTRSRAFLAIDTCLQAFSLTSKLECTVSLNHFFRCARFYIYRDSDVDILRSSSRVCPSSML